MQNIVVCNQPNKLRSIKRFIQSRGLQRYTIIKDSSELKNYLLLETSNVYVFDYFLDMPLVNALSDMRDSVNTLSVFVPSEQIGATYLNLTDKIHIMPDEVALLQWMWDTQATSIHNVMACHAAGIPYCRVGLPNTNVRPDRIQVSISPTPVQVTYQTTSGQTRREKIPQLNVRVSMKGTKILEDEYNIRNQVGIFSDVQRELDLPFAEGGEYSGQEVLDQEIKEKRSLADLFSFGPKEPKPKKEKTPKPKKEKTPKPKKEKKPKKGKEIPADAGIQEAFPPIDQIPPIQGMPVPEQNITMPQPPVMPPQVETQGAGFEIPQPVIHEAEAGAKKPSKGLFGKKPKAEKETSADQQPEGIKDVSGSTYSDTNFTQVFNTVAAKTASESTVDTSEADELQASLKPTEVKPVEEPAAEHQPVVESQPEPVPQPEPIPQPKPEPRPVQRQTIDLNVVPPVQQSAAGPDPYAAVQSIRSTRLSMRSMKGKFFTSVEDYLVGNEIITAKQRQEFSTELAKRRHSGEVIRFYDLIIEKGLVSAEEMVKIISKVNRMEILNHAQIEKLQPIFDDFPLEHCKKLRFFRAPDKQNGDVRIICSLDAESIDASIKRLFDSPCIQYTLDAYVMEVLNRQ